MLSSAFAGRLLPLALALLLGLAAVHVPASAEAGQQPATQRPSAVTARVNVAKPAGKGDAVPSAVYGQRGDGLPTTGIFVRKKRSLEQQVTASIDQLEELDDYASGEPQLIADPIEPWNRFWFGFNDIFYLYVANPAYRFWETVTPRQLRTGISNVFRNLLFPMRFINNLLQFRFKEAGVEFGRFIVNSTAGLGGLVDIAKHKKTIVPVHPEGEDFGQTLGRWGFGHGFYIVWPFIGPSSVRETFGRAGDYFLYPAFWASYVIHPWYVPTGIQTGFFFNDLDDVLPTYFDLKKAAVDPYIMMREAWVKHRAVQVAR
ncbi:MAG: VacJ family lipoprotein [Desulfovibrio sp.]|nr:VacJ family lipoprotein [Desulfovibrio sp.]